MGMTLSEKILANHAGLQATEAGELLIAAVDGIMLNDVSGPIALRQFAAMERESVFDREKVYLIMDHQTPNATPLAARQCKFCRDFARGHKLDHFYDTGRVGIEHAFLPEQGLVLPGQLFVGGDSHTCTYGSLGAFSSGMGSTVIASAMALGTVWLRVPETIRFIYRGKLNDFVAGKDLILHTIGRIGVDGATYKAVEFAGPVMENLSMFSRFTMCNMAIECGAKTGIVEPDATTEAYVRTTNAAGKPYSMLTSDADAAYADIIEIDVSSLEPQVALPFLPENSVGVSACNDVAIDQVIIGTCTNGWIEDLRAAAGVLKGKKVHPYVRALVVPATNAIYRQALREGLIDIFLDAGAAVSTPTCGPCFGGHTGVLAEGEKAVSTANRNFKGRMGPGGEVFLAGPAVAAASAVKGRIAHPGEVIR